jgi:arylsulfatase
MEDFDFTETTFHGLRFGDWKFLFMVQDEWFNGVQEDLVTPPITNLRLDPSERFHEARGFDELLENRSWTMVPALGLVERFLAAFEDCPPRQASFDADVDSIVEQIMRGANQP